MSGQFCTLAMFVFSLFFLAFSSLKLVNIVNPVNLAFKSGLDYFIQEKYSLQIWRKGKNSHGDLGPVLLFPLGKIFNLNLEKKGKNSEGDLGPVLLVCVCPLRRQHQRLVYLAKTLEIFVSTQLYRIFYSAKNLEKFVCMAKTREIFLSSHLYYRIMLFVSSYVIREIYVLNIYQIYIKSGWLNIYMKGGRGAAEKHEDIPCLSSKLPQVCSLNQYQSSQIFVYLEEEFFYSISKEYYIS